MVEVVFNYEGNQFYIPCNTNDKMKDIINQFLDKINNIEVKNNLIYLYDGKNINFELTLNEQINELDKNKKQMEINVIHNNKDINKIKQIISKDIICPYCKENIFMKIKNFKIYLHGCKNYHIHNDVLLNLFEESQKINLNSIECDICKINDKSNSYNNEFYICYTCNKYLCSSCKSNHDKNHGIINYDDKNYICKIHNEPFVKYCKTCKEEICLACEKVHEKHETKTFKSILPDKNDLLKNMKNLKNVIDKYKEKINIAKEIFNRMQYLFELYYKINNNIINNYKKSKINYHKLINLNNLNKNNEKLIKKLNDIINKDKISEIYEFSFNNFYNVNGEKYIGEMKNGLKEGKGILYYDKDNENKRKIYEGEFKNDKPDGKGIMVWNNDERYEGDFKNDNFEGKGIFYFKNGNKYEGDYKNNIKEGKGIYCWDNGDRYEGEWNDGKREGKGIYYWNDGHIYKGGWKNDKRDGKGIDYDINGNIYEGYYEEDKKQGYGIIYYNNGERYEGYFHNDKNCLPKD